MARRVTAALLWAFALVLFELCRQLATRHYSPFGIWPEPDPDATMYYGVGVLLLIIGLLALTRKLNKE